MFSVCCKGIQYYRLLCTTIICCNGTNCMFRVVCPDRRNVGKNVFEQLPTKGLERLLHLKTFNNPNLRQFPSPEHFPRIQSLVLSYAYHCCSFLPLQPSDDDPPPSAETSLHESVIFPANENDFDMTLWNSSMSDIWPQLR